MLCKCVFSETYNTLENCLRQLEEISAAAAAAGINSGDLKNKLKEMKRVLRTLQQESKVAYRNHAGYRRDFGREMMAAAKLSVPNVHADRGEQLRISTWTLGDVKEMRKPPKKKCKKERNSTNVKIKKETE